MTKYNGMIFDFNGVLWWDNRLQDESWRDYSTALRGYPLTEIEMSEDVHGRNGQYTLELLSRRPLTAEEAFDLMEQKETIYRRLCLQQGERFRLSHGAVDLLEYLGERQIPYTIATASARPNVDFFFDHLDLGRWFDLEKVVYDDGTMAGKPAPDFYLEAAARLNLQPGDCIVVEDSLSGMYAAQAAGIGRIFGVIGDAGHALRGDLPDEVTLISDLSDLDRSLF